MEVMRMSSIAMQTVPRRAMRDTTLMGYYIPKDAFVHISVWAAHMDKTYWVDPENFRPERHIGEDGKLKKHGFNLMPFGFGNYFSCIVLPKCMLTHCYGCSRTCNQVKCQTLTLCWRNIKRGFSKKLSFNKNVMTDLGS